MKSAIVFGFVFSVVVFQTYAQEQKSENGLTEAEKQAIDARIEYLIAKLGNEEYLAAMLSTVSAIRDEISHRLDYWQEKETLKKEHEPVSHAILTGGNASIRGLSEYLENALKIPVTTGDVFTN